MNFVKFSKTLFFLQTTSDRNASENLRDAFVQQIFSLQLKLYLRLIYFHFILLLLASQKCPRISFLVMFHKDTSYRKKCIMKNFLKIVKNQAVALRCIVTKETPIQGIFWEFCEIPKSISFTENYRTAASGNDPG